MKRIQTSLNVRPSELLTVKNTELEMDSLYAAKYSDNLFYRCKIISISTHMKSQEYLYQVLHSQFLTCKNTCIFYRNNIKYNEVVNDFRLYNMIYLANNKDDIQYQNITIYLINNVVLMKNIIFAQTSLFRYVLLIMGI